ncbi:MAG: hypothetical protein II943_09070 [Victivallales bacterium]|nr:hypothetical protein [Victivallales bacterium]
MTWTAFLFILLSVFLHAGWNLLLKEHKPSLAFCFLLSCCALFCMLPCIILCPLPMMRLPWKFWACMGGSIVGELLYTSSLAHGYKLFDFSLFYPLARALPVAMLAVGSFFLPLGRQRPGAWALVGMGILFLGCLCMASRNKRLGDSPERPAWMLWFWAVIGATGTCFYTGFDNAATNLVKDSGVVVWGLLPSCAYFCLVEIGLVVGNGLIVACIPEERKAFREIFGKTWTPLVAGFFDALCYSLVLIAYTKATNASMVFAFRQLGLPVGFLAGVLFLHEKAKRKKVIGLTAIVAGLLISVLPADWPQTVLFLWRQFVHAFF